MECGGTSKCHNYPGSYRCECFLDDEYYDATRQRCVSSTSQQETDSAVLLPEPETDPSELCLIMTYSGVQRTSALPLAAPATGEFQASACSQLLSTQCCTKEKGGEMQHHDKQTGINFPSANSTILAISLTRNCVRMKSLNFNCTYFLMANKNI